MLRTSLVRSRRSKSGSSIAHISTKNSGGSIDYGSTDNATRSGSSIACTSTKHTTRLRLAAASATHAIKLAPTAKSNTRTGASYAGKAAAPTGGPDLCRSAQAPARTARAACNAPARRTLGQYRKPLCRYAYRWGIGAVSAG
eukprot:1686063-Rhodomonas_salina.2